MPASPSMAKHTNWEPVLIGVLSVVLGMIAFALGGSIFDFFFVAMVIAVLFDYSNKLNSMQRRLDEVEAKVAQRSD